uniref:NADH-ubiquinone oxidoreductase chain 4L n=1 Tax=Virgulibracon endoxylaphagus TaxID=2933211 RepID=A0A8T9JCW6_9HYME|nr:NADH dehydrogenase subunit 4L [Virgulibracon endoxylaphagus]UOK09633.1 NADH dehydrogenase subunit 4L [Virgulibracon endoxylaphagus]
MWQMFLFNFMFFFISMLMVSFYYNHILLNLISLEFLMVNLFYNIYYLNNYINLNMYFYNFFLCVMICEGILGLSLMIYMIRNSGNDYSNLFVLLKW